MKFVEILREQITAMAAGFVAMLPSMAMALVVVIVTWLVAKFAVRIADFIIRRTRLREDMRQLLETVVRVAIWVAGLLIAAATAIPGFNAAGMIAGLGIGALAIGFAFQDIFENFLAGLLIMLRDKMNIGDLIEAEGVTGTVERVTLRETHIRQYSNELTIVPNSMIFKNPVKIVTDMAERRNEAIVGVSYDTDLAQAEAAIRTAVQSVGGLAEGRPIDVFVTEFNASSVDFLVRWWTDIRANNYFQVKSDVLCAIKQALDAAGIEIPFPYVTHTFKEPVPLADDGHTKGAAPAAGPPLV